MFKIAVIYSTVAVAQGRDCSNDEIEDAVAQFNADNVDDAAQCATDSGKSFKEVNGNLPNFDLPVVNDKSCASTACQNIFAAVDAFDLPECDLSGLSTRKLYDMLLKRVRAEWSNCGDGTGTGTGTGTGNGTGTTMPSSSASVLSMGIAAMSAMAVMFLL